MSTAENGVITSGARERTNVLSPMGVAEAAGVRGLLPARTGAIIIAAGLTAAGVMDGWSITHCEYRNLTDGERDLASRVQKWAWANKRKGGCLIDREAVDHEAWAAILRITHPCFTGETGYSYALMQFAGPEGAWKTVTPHGTLVAIHETDVQAARLADFLNGEEFGTAQKRFIIQAELQANPTLRDWLNANLTPYQWEEIVRTQSTTSIPLHLKDWMIKLYADELRHWSTPGAAIYHSDLERPVVERVEELLHDLCDGNDRSPHADEEEE